MAIDRTVSSVTAKDTIHIWWLWSHLTWIIAIPRAIEHDCCVESLLFTNAETVVITQVVIFLDREVSSVITPSTSPAYISLNSIVVFRQHGMFLVGYSLKHPYRGHAHFKSPTAVSVYSDNMKKKEICQPTVKGLSLLPDVTWSIYPTDVPNRGCKIKTCIHVLISHAVCSYMRFKPMVYLVAVQACKLGFITVGFWQWWLELKSPRHVLN